MCCKKEKSYCNPTLFVQAFISIAIIIYSMVILIFHTIENNNLNSHCDNLNIEGIYLPIITGISGYWLPSPSNATNSNEKSFNEQLTEQITNQITNQINISNENKIKKKVNNIFIIQTIISLMIMGFCMFMLVYNKECNVQGVYLPILTGISTYWVPSPGTISTDKQEHKINNNDDKSETSTNDNDNI